MENNGENEKNQNSTEGTQVQAENTPGSGEAMAEKGGLHEEHAPGETELLKSEVAELKDKYLRLYSEFDNFKRRTAKERIDLVKTANEETLSSLITVVDDFERAIKAMTDATQIESIKEGVQLIYSKLVKTLESKGLKAMESSVGKEFNIEIHDAITQIPAPTEELKGKIVDEVEKGYYLNDKVIRFAKVVTGA